MPEEMQSLFDRFLTQNATYPGHHLTKASNGKDTPSPIIRPYPASRANNGGGWPANWIR